MSNPNFGCPSGFGCLLYTNFLIKKKYRVDAIAKEMFIAPDTLYRYCRSENIIPPDRIIDLVRATGDIEYLEFFCEPCGYIPVTKAQAKLCEASREREEINMTVLWGHTLEDIERNFRDGNLTKKEYGEIHRHLIRLQELAAELDQKIKGEVK